MVRVTRRIFSLLFIFLFSTLSFAQDRGFSNEWSTMHYPATRTYDMKHMKMDLVLDYDARSVAGTVSSTLSPLNDNLTQIEFDAVDLNISAVGLFMDTSTASGSTNGIIPLNFEMKAGKLVITLDRPYNSDEEITIQTTYQANPQLGLYFVEPDSAYPNKHQQIWTQGEMIESRNWIPSFDATNDRMTTEMRVTVPAGQMAISNGELLSIEENTDAGTVTYHWRENVAHVTYLISLVVGDYVEHKTTWDGIPVMYYVHPSESDKVERSFGETPAMMQFFSDVTGIRYPYEKYAQTTIEDFMFGGMENISATSQTNTTLHDERAHLDRSSHGLVAHELAHQWFGDLITTKDWANVWLNEGFATYFTGLYIEHSRGRREYIMALEGNANNYKNEDKNRYRRPIVTHFFENPIDMFDAHLYQKGAQVLHMLRYMLGDDLWWKGLRHYAATHQGTTVETNDFQQAMEDATGQSLGWFFEQWVHKAGHPEYEISWEWARREKEVLLTVKQVQTVDEITPLFRMPVVIEMNDGRNIVRQTIEVAEIEETFHLPMSKKPNYLIFDPDDGVLKDLKFEKKRNVLLTQLANGGDIARMRAVVALPDVANGRVVKALGRVLSNDEFRGVRAKAATALRQIGTKAARNQLFGGLQDSLASIRRATLSALDEYRGDKNVAAELEKVFRNDKSYYAQAEAVRSLAKIGAQNATAICYEALEMHSDREVIFSQALNGLVDLNDAGAIEIALTATTYGQIVNRRTAGLNALARLAKKFPERSDEIVDHLIVLLEDKAFQVRYSAIGALARIGDPRAIGPLQAMKEREPSPRRKTQARAAIKTIEEAVAGR